jgi:hypothetical protein
MRARNLDAEINAAIAAMPVGEVFLMRWNTYGGGVCLRERVRGGTIVLAAEQVGGKGIWRGRNQEEEIDDPRYTAWANGITIEMLDARVQRLLVGYLKLFEPGDDIDLAALVEQAKEQSSG